MRLESQEKDGETTDYKRRKGRGNKTSRPFSLGHRSSKGEKRRNGCGGEESGGSREWQINRFLRNLLPFSSRIVFDALHKT